MTDFADFAEFNRTANTAAAERLADAREITLATLEVLKSFTAILVPVTVALLPNSEKLVPAVDTVVDRSFATVVKAVESQNRFAVAALNQLATATAAR